MIYAAKGPIPTIVEKADVVERGYHILADEPVKVMCLKISSVFRPNLNFPGKPQIHHPEWSAN
jgi:hypothetical protein